LHSLPFPSWTQICAPVMCPAVSCLNKV
jgi:hypothetical protein